MDNVKLAEIKGSLVDINDYSLYIFILMVILGLAVVAFAGFWAFKKLKIRREKNLEKLYLQALHDIDWSDPKEASYKITKYGRLLATDEKRKEIFSHLLPLLEQYKYRKSVGSSVDPKTMREFELFKQVCDESI